MLRELLFAKIHQAVVTGCHRDYVGSVTIDPVLLDATGMVVNEKVLVADCESGARFETYIFKGERGSGEVRINGAAANLTAVGHRVLIMSFAHLTPQEMKSHRPTVVVCDEHNAVAEVLWYDPAPAQTAELSRPT